MPPGWETKPSKTHHCPKHGQNCDWDRKQGYCKEHQFKCKTCGWSGMKDTPCMTCKKAREVRAAFSCNVESLIRTSWLITASQFRGKNNAPRRTQRKQRRSRRGRITKMPINGELVLMKRKKKLDAFYGATELDLSRAL